MLVTNIKQQFGKLLYFPFRVDFDIEPMAPIKRWLDGMEIQDPQVARWICSLVPSQCPFERDIAFFGRHLIHIPPMCKLNPLYEQLVGLRFRALTYLAENCSEDISRYC